MVQTVSSVKVYDGLGGAITWPGSAYTLDLVGEPAVGDHAAGVGAGVDRHARFAGGAHP